ncbi:hypothetical protein [Mesorhizobium sp. ES1-1]|uniref:hypothetical protein n=1 Tax=Mesorhizobium sp. ES1-1 TaxID=2876629 RepID=UPI001CCC67C8|nr:hypothetical protein [Mesorhizobium sp. ES1-1]MBZ9674529.1 hypothetical protein [Mesorhizobium sp. ES1-1]
MYGTKEIQGVKYPLQHLNPFTMTVAPQNPGAPSYRVHVRFGSHTFSREWLAADPIEHQVDYNGDIRCFCTTRHGLSAHLPAMIRASANGKVHFSLKDNYLVLQNVPGCIGPYVAFFSLKPSNSNKYDAFLFVQSAHERTAFPKAPPSISMATLVSKVVRGLPIVKPKK